MFCGCTELLFAAEGLLVEASAASKAGLGRVDVAVSGAADPIDASG